MNFFRLHSLPLLLLWMGMISPLVAEEVATESSDPAVQGEWVDETPPTREEISRMKLSLLAQLAAKFVDKTGNLVSIVVLNPIDSTHEQVGPYVTEAIRNAFARYGNFDVRLEDYTPKAMNLLELRRAIVNFRTKILFVPVISDTTFDLYLYDRRSPYKLFVHSEQLPPVDQLRLSPEVAATLAKLLLRRTLYRYIKDEYFDLPHQMSAPFLNSEIPRWIASQRSLNMVNREAGSMFYASISAGAALSLGEDKEYFSSNLIGAQIGVRLFGNLYGEAAVKAFSYNAFSGSLKYILTAKDSPFRLVGGLGISYATNKKVWNLDTTDGLGSSSYYVVPSLQILFPIGDVYLSVEGQAYYGLDKKNYIFTMAPGLMVLF